jgi:hypothetical protein
LPIRKTGQTTFAVKPLECERRFLDFIRIIIEGGWVVQDELEWMQILDFLDVAHELKESTQLVQFFTQVSNLYGFHHIFQDVYLKQEAHKIMEDSLIYYGEITADEEED